MIETYWNEMFGAFKTGDRSFQLPGFPEPLMSPRFGQTNFIGSCPTPAKLSLKLCGFRASRNNLVQIRVDKLASVIGQESFWHHQKNFQPETFPFIQRLLPFLVENRKPHYYFSIQNHMEVIATAIGGEGKSKCLLFNLNVREEYRGKGVARQILTEARNFFSEKETFYWTVHPGFSLGAHYVDDYYIV